MIKIFQSATLLMCASLCALAYAQDQPAVTGPSAYRGFRLPDAAGTLTLALSGTESARSGYYGTGGAVYSTILSGDVAYLSNSAIHPFSLVYSGGYTYVSSGQPSSPFQNLALSQTIGSRNWNLVLNDSVRYLPESPSTGLSGLPGLGDLGIPPQPTNGGGQDILSRYSQRVINGTGANFERRVTGSTSIVGDGNFALQRFVGSSVIGYDYNAETGGIGVKHRIDALSSFSVKYAYTHFAYINKSFSFDSQSASLDYSRQWSRRLSTDLAFGPERHASSDATLGGASLDFSGNVAINYALEHGSVDFKYVHGVQSGSGVIQGAIADSTRVDVSHRVGEYGNVSLSGSYSSHRQIFSVNSFSTSSVIGALQASRLVGNNFSVYASYNAQQQTSQGTVAGLNGFSGLSQTVSLGLTYSPKPKHVGH